MVRWKGWEFLLLIAFLFVILTTSVHAPTGGCTITCNPYLPCGPGNCGIISQYLDTATCTCQTTGSCQLAPGNQCWTGDYGGTCAGSPHGIQHCTSSCSWECLSVECTQSSQCDDANPCTTDTCGAGYTCSHTPWSGSCTTGGYAGTCVSGVCEVPCSTFAGFCASPQPANSTPVPAGYCGTAQSCYACAAGYTYSGGACILSCSDACSPSGQTRCDPANVNATQTCVSGSAGCLVWGSSQACPAGEACSAGACVATCTDECVSGAQQCSGTSVQTCGYYGAACLHWNTTATCAAPTPLCQQSGNTASCVVCVSAPPDPATVLCGQTQSYLLCTGATGSVTGTQCSAGFSCNASGQCVAGCTPTCTQSGATQCSANSVQTCALATSGCLAWATTATCADPTPVCSAASGAAACVAAACVDGRDNSSVCAGAACGSALDSCGVARVCGSCADWQVCSNGSCAAASVVVTPGDAGVVTAGSWFTLPVALSPESSSYVLSATGWPASPTVANTPGSRSVSGLPGSDEVGSHTLTLNVALAATGAPLAQKSVTLNVVCNPADAVVGACCDSGSGLYRGEGAGCAFNSSVTGTCTASHACVQVCMQNVAERCHGDAVTYVDSCGAWGGVVDDCAVPAADGANRTCVEAAGGASCVEEAPACTGAYSYACRANDGVRIDTSCGLVATLVQCGSDETCEATASGVACRARAPCDDAPGTISCGTRCVDPLSSRTDCGGCGRACSETQQCVAGNCAAIPGCNVVCDSNAECGAGEVCVYAGDCTLSQCQAVNVLAQDAAGVANLTAALTQAGLVQVAVTIQGPVLTYTLTNLGPAPVANVTVTSTIGKVVAARASGLVVSGASYVVLEEDPVLRFSVPQLATTKRFSVTADHVLDVSYVNLIVNDVTYDATGDLFGAWNATKEALTIGLNSEYDGNQTTFHLTLTPSKSLGGLSVPLEIPKCLAQKAAQLQLSGNYHIVQDDPLIVWQFNRLDAPSEITFSVAGNISDDCKAQLRAMAYSQAIGKPINPLFGLALIPIIGFLLLFFQRFTPGGSRKHLSRDEFAQIAKQQGFGKEETERQWAEYRRRF